MTPDLHLWIIPVLPLVGAAVNGFLGKKFSRQTVTAVALLFSGAAFAMVLLVASRFSSLSVPHPNGSGLYIKLRDDPATVSTVALPVSPLDE